jgi:hypothetical protein
MSFAIGGARYDLSIAGMADAPVDQANPPRDTSSTYATLRIQGVDGPVPGSALSFRGSRPSHFSWASFPGLVLGGVAGAAAVREHFGAAALLGLATLGGAAAAGYAMRAGGYGFAYGAAFVAMALLGFFGLFSWHERSRATGLAACAGAVLGAVGTAVAYPAWQPLGPLVALAAGVAIAAMLRIILQLASVLVPEPHPLRRWLLSRAATKARGGGRRRTVFKRG